MKSLAQFLIESEENKIVKQEVQEAIIVETVTENHSNIKEWKNAAKKLGCVIVEENSLFYAGDKASTVTGEFNPETNIGHLTFPKVEETYSGLDGTQYGSNEGGVHEDEKGNKFYIKFPKHEEQARVEVATAKLYNKMGIDTVNPRLEQIDGRTAVVSDWNHNMKMMGRTGLQELAKQPHHAMDLAKMRHAAVITGNRDIVGLEYDNIGYDVKRDKLISLDQGGSMHYRAQGGSKPFEREVGEHESFDNPRYTPHHVFGTAVQHHPDVLRNAIDHVKNLKDDDIRSIMSEHGLDDHKETVVDRKKLLLKKY